MSGQATKVGEPLALRGGPKAVTADPGDLFTWPIVTDEDEQAVLEVLRAGAMSGIELTRQFEAEFAAWQGTQHALAHCNGTAALQAAMWACGLRRGDELICPSMTYWASGLPALTLGATIVWADIQRHSLCLDPADLGKRITDRTKVIVVVHYAGYPADVEAVLRIAEPRAIKVIEDVSHAHGAVCNGRKAGTIGHCAAMSMMSGKSFAIGEGGMLVTDDRQIHERAVAWGHYERTGRMTDDLTLDELKRFGGLPWGGVKHRIHQLSSAMGRVQLRHYDERNEEILRAMNRFWDALEGTPGLIAHRPPPGGDSRMGGWYYARGLYDADALGGLPIERFVEALAAEGVPTDVGCNRPLHLHPMVTEADIYGDGRPTILAHADRDVRAPAGSLPVSEATPSFVFGVPWFKQYRPAAIDEHVTAVKKVVAHADELR
jgi:dTDP-4-amino-4,6-dideoxygalactose transaminase